MISIKPKNQNLEEWTVYLTNENMTRDNTGNLEGRSRRHIGNSILQGTVTKNIVNWHGNLILHLSPLPLPKKTRENVDCYLTGRFVSIKKLANHR